MWQTIYYLPKNSLQLKHNCYLFMFIDKTNKSTFCTPSSLRTWCIFTNTQLIGAYGTQWVPCSFEVWVCSRIIMSLIWDQFSKDTREKLPKKYSLHQENIFCQRGQVHFSIDRWHCNKSFYQWISPLKYYKIHKIELQSFCYHIIY